LAEMRHEVAVNDKDKTEQEMGDVFFALVNYARFVGVNPEDALERTNKKFINRFKFMEDEIKLVGKNMQDMTLTELDEFWNKAKSKGI